MNTLYAAASTTITTPGVGICSVDLTAALHEIQLTPDGVFRARDGRPEKVKGWIMNAANAERVIQAANNRQTPFVIDYEHQTLLADQNGQPAPAAGWFKGVEYRPGEGLFAKVEWTERAKQMIEGGEYKFISPVFEFDNKTGDIFALFNAALTNSPAIDGMNAVLARAAAMVGFHDDPEETVNWKEKLIELLGLNAEASDDDVLTALQGCIEVAADTEEAKEEVESLKTELAVLKAAGGDNPDPAKFVPVQVVEDLRTQIEALSTNQTQREVEEIIAAALNDERGPLLLEAQVEWARELGKKDLAALKQYLETATPIAALRSTQTGIGYKPPASRTPMDDGQLAILKNLGVGDDKIDSLQKEATT